MWFLAGPGHDRRDTFFDGFGFHILVQNQAILDHFGDVCCFGWIELSSLFLVTSVSSITKRYN